MVCSDKSKHKIDWWLSGSKDTGSNGKRLQLHVEFKVTKTFCM